VSANATTADRFRAILAMARSTKGVTVLQLKAIGVSDLDAILAAFDPMYEALKAHEAYDHHRETCEDCAMMSPHTMGDPPQCEEADRLEEQARSLRRAALAKAEGGG
jgi:hypothetical protein